VSPFDLYYATFTWRGTMYERPWLLIRPEGSTWLCFAVSSEDYDSTPFEIHETDPDFPATGLDHTSYVYDAESFHVVPITSMRKRLGCLEGSLLTRFRNYAGV
jgi:hypothetical protein